MKKRFELKGINSDLLSIEDLPYEEEEDEEEERKEERKEEGDEKDEKDEVDSLGGSVAKAPPSKMQTEQFLKISQQYREIQSLKVEKWEKRKEEIQNLEGEEVPILELPYEMMIEIFQHLDIVKEFCSLSLVCKYFSAACRDDELWYPIVQKKLPNQKIEIDDSTSWMDIYVDHILSSRKIGGNFCWCRVCEKIKWPSQVSCSHSEKSFLDVDEVVSYLIKSFQKKKNPNFWDKEPFQL
eukprot:CAMPEP_0201501710 /NCGR_PEP_ID=MMETSP0151_2-20130828/83735_1 /ASSEMBLY_ACC=CAM_ASM_000257 /TAXON_ID=200890 /ORGANISM="Paramoeba atlantica, Strain 621/1 / CCAP 1560/9" /LENGTH=238 /DNA_ID=CAMNT_0047895237 /DNA_START=882 /DNA_END=1598 /DNA_ORIENTATION=-